ncbi:hypothetical protein [Roseinatronobacter alkalisoli]|uniref:Uncharacterized protein n=1 Tax=Roseinatronobacter alkalisoli TaxID=3028235 RepID=A0ABT5T725_9RHOB|nr:hypothetical protein [Roseinatronobacter sp. HJB301]MDD7970912.1 hypothetical protein [Roseinatronobacter sp. HJB301]
MVISLFIQAALACFNSAFSARSGLASAARSGLAPVTISISARRISFATLWPVPNPAALTDRYALLATATPLAALTRNLVTRMVDAAQGRAAGRTAYSTVFDPVLWLPESL